jgi:hypothetical protein
LASPHEMKWPYFSIRGVNQYQRIQRWDEMRWDGEANAGSSRSTKLWWGNALSKPSYGTWWNGVRLLKRSPSCYDLHRKWWRCQRSCQKSAWLTLGCSQTGICSSMTPQCLLFSYHASTNANTNFAQKLSQKPIVGSVSSAPSIMNQLQLHPIANAADHATVKKPAAQLHILWTIELGLK